MKSLYTQRLSAFCRQNERGAWIRVVGQIERIGNVETGQAFEMGYRSAACGFFYDGMEVIAAASLPAGGFEPLAGAIELVGIEKEQVNADMDWLCTLCAAAYRRPIEAPLRVDEYRLLLTEHIFDIVNRWSYIADIKQVSQLQAWFYAGFGLGRARTVFAGLRLYDRLREISPCDAVEQMPRRLEPMAGEAARQCGVAADEDDLTRVRPLLQAVSQTLDPLALALSAATIGGEPVRSPAEIAEAVQLIESVRDRIRLDFGTPTN